METPDSIVEVEDKRFVDQQPSLLSSVCCRGRNLLVVWLFDGYTSVLLITTGRRAQKDNVNKTMYGLLTNVPPLLSAEDAER